MELLAWLVAASVTFQSVVSADDAGEAYERVHYPTASDEYESEDDDGNPTGDPIAPWPRAVIEQGPEWEETKIGVADWKRAGALYFTLNFEVPATEVGEKAQQTWFLNRAGAIVHEMRDLSATGEAYTDAGISHLNVIGISIEDGPWPNPPQHEMQLAPDQPQLLPRWWIVFLVRWQG